MTTNLQRELGALTREVRRRELNGKPARAIVATRVYDTTIDDAWSALTDRERIPRWFLPIGGDLRAGGRYQFEGNAGGEIVTCEPPRRLEITWEYAGRFSRVEVRLTEESHGRTRLELQHIVPVDDHWEEYGAGAVGIGWELALSGLAEHLATGASSAYESAMEWSHSVEGKSFIHSSSNVWMLAAIGGGEKERDARTAGGRVAAFYSGEKSA
jgi:uncharacterized protein YndB with AHSA1/START domain